MKNTFIRKIILLNFAIISGIAASFAQTITTGTISPTTYCAGSSISVPFETAGTFPVGTVFKAQLSDAAGSFSSAVEIGTIDSENPINARIPFTTASGAGYKVRVISSATPAIIGTASAVLTVNAAPEAPVTQKDIYRCEGAAALTLTATGTALKWYSFTPSTPPVKTLLSGAPTLPVATGGAYGLPEAPSYLVTQTVGGCESSAAEVYIIPRYVSATPIVTNPGDVCQNSTVTADLLKGAIQNYDFNVNYYGWRDGATTGVDTPIPSTATVGSKDYYVWSNESMKCASPEVKVTVKVVAAPAAPTVVATVNYTVGATATALTATGTNLKWYSVVSGGTALGAAPTPLTTTAGTKSYWVTQSATVDGCESPRAKIDVVVATCVLSAEPTSATPVNYCASTAAAPALTATGTAIKWYNAAGTLLASAPVPNLNVSSTTTTKYYVTQTEAGGKCESPKKEIVVNVYKTPAPGVSADPVEYCVGETATPLTATGTALKWYSSLTGNTTVSSTPLTTTAGNQIFYVSQTLNDCESERSRIDVKVKAAPAVPTVTAVAPVCEDATVASSILLNAVTPKTALLWYSAATGGQGSATVPAVITTTSGTNKYYVTQTVNGCESATRATVSLEIKAAPAAPTVTTPVAYCQNQTGATALTATGTNLTWYNAAGTELTAAPIPVTTTVGTVSYYVTQTTNYTGPTLACEGPKAKLDVKTNSLPASVAITPDTLCQERADKTYTFESTVGGNAVKWYKTLTGGTAETAVPTLNLKTAGETTYFATQVDLNKCESAVRVKKNVLVKPLPGLPTVTPSSLAYCQFVGAVPLTATPSTGASLNWFGTNATGGSSSGAAPTPSTQEGGTTSYYVAQTLNGCLGDRAKIDVTINTTPVPQTTTALAFCQGVTAEPLTATGNELRWYRTTTGESQSTPFTPFTEKVEDYSFYVTQTGAANRCESPKQEIKVHIKALPSASISGNSTIDLGGTTSVRIDFTSDGPWKYILSDGKTGETSTQNLDVQVRPSVTTTYRITEVSNACGKGFPLGSAIVTVKVPTITTGNPSVAEACAGKTFQVLFQKSGDFPAANQFRVQIAPQSADTMFYSIPSAVNGSTITATFPDTTKGGNYVVRVVSEGADPAFTVKGSVSQIPITAKPLAVATISGSQTIVIGESAQLSVTLTSTGPWSFNLNNGTTDSLINAGSSPYTVVVAPAKTTTYKISSVSNVCGNGRVEGTARVQVDPILGVEPPVKDWAKVYPTVVHDQCTVEISGKIDDAGVSVDVMNMNGQMLQHRSSKDKINNLNFSNYPSGLYLIRVGNGALKETHKVIKP